MSVVKNARIIWLDICLFTWLVFNAVLWNSSLMQWRPVLWWKQIVHIPGDTHDYPYPAGTDFHVERKTKLDLNKQRTYWWMASEYCPALGQTASCEWWIVFSMAFHTTMPLMLHNWIIMPNPKRVTPKWHCAVALVAFLINPLMQRNDLGASHQCDRDGFKTSSCYFHLWIMREGLAACCGWSWASTFQLFAKTF